MAPLKITLKDPARWIWFAVLICLGYGLFLSQAGFLFAIIVSVVNLQAYVFWDKSFTSFSVQVRLAILGLFLLGQIPGAGWIYWIPFIGISIRNLTGYCFLARVMSLLPWNRTEFFSWELVKRKIFTAPTSGSALKI